MPPILAHGDQVGAGLTAIGRPAACPIAGYRLAPDIARQNFPGGGAFVSGLVDLIHDNDRIAPTPGGDGRDTGIAYSCPAL